MPKIPPKLRSRKLWMALAGVVLPIVGAYLSAEVDLAEAIKLSVAAVIAYCVSQGFVDAKTMEGWVPDELKASEPGASDE